MFKRNNLAALAAFSAMMLPQTAFAAGLNGGELSFVWAVPFIGVLLCIAICPLVVPNFWHHHFGASSFWQGSCFLGSGVCRADVYLLRRRCGG